MSKQKKPKMTCRYYEIPPGGPVLALLGKDHAPSGGDGMDCLHFHNHMEIGYCRYGSGVMTLGDEKIPFANDCFTIVPKNYPHMTGFDADTGCLWDYLIIDADGFLAKTYGDNPHLADRLCRRINRRGHLCSAQDQTETAALIGQIIEGMRQRRELYQEEIKGLLLALLIRAAQWNRDEKEEPYLPHMDNSTIISPALDYISMVPERPIRIEELAAMCHISETHFRRIFVEYMKMPPVKYINQVRIRRACDELQRTNDSISSIAARAGFATLSTFNRNFRQITGISPQQLRKQPALYEQRFLEYGMQANDDMDAPHEPRPVP